MGHHQPHRPPRKLAHGHGLILDAVILRIRQPHRVRLQQAVDLPHLQPQLLDLFLAEDGLQVHGDRVGLGVGMPDELDAHAAADGAVLGGGILVAGVALHRGASFRDGG
ncbi:hypothetical protein CSPHI_04855 [Corynebacterium sphenisci DSM 44792]|uniref:Uncharacterized protein n=1 Tax=Corynebacterium sphenisci DSM 44792 TaxID=1437874 RepID=A0A1L7CX79_9CORY|nr:hypothetical protein CSPHI_04855 [Corynebacterium sphenisci DSM 44792]